MYKVKKFILSFAWAFCFVIGCKFLNLAQRIDDHTTRQLTSWRYRVANDAIRQRIHTNDYLAFVEARDRIPTKYTTQSQRHSDIKPSK